jgi:hypothetical protein
MSCADIDDESSVGLAGTEPDEPDRRSGCELPYSTMTNTLFHSLTLSFCPGRTPCVERPLSDTAGHMLEITPLTYTKKKIAATGIYFFIYAGDGP